MSAPSDGQALDQKTAGLGDDALRRLDATAERVDRLDAYVGGPEKLGAATGDVLVEAVERAETERHRELSKALSPLVVTAIRSEMKRSKDMIVEALYPMMGRLVTTAVAAAFRDLIETLNARIDALVSAHSWRLRLRALLTGRSMAEVALAEVDAGRLKRALLLERGSGRVLAAWPSSEQQPGNVDLQSGLIAAITELAADLYADEKGELRMLDLGSSNVFLRASPRVIVAAEFGGELPRHHERRLDEAFMSIVERHENDEKSLTSDTIATQLSEALAAEAMKPKSKAPVIGAGLIVAGLAIWAAIGPATRAWRESRIRRAFEGAVATYDQLAQYPLRLEIDHDAGRVVLRGLAANEEEPQAVVDAIAPAAAPYKVERGVAVVALAQETAHLKAAETRAREILKEARAEIDALRAELKDARAISKADARDKLRRLSQSFAVFLSERDNIIDPSATEAKLDELAELLKLTGSDLRVVGYADKAGSAGVNRALARKRADMIVAKLVERGVPRARLAPVGRATLDPIADADLEKSRSRRVVFEIPFDGEFDVK